MIKVFCDNCGLDCEGKFTNIKSNVFVWRDLESGT
jgi:hypothetical protein